VVSVCFVLSHTVGLSSNPNPENNPSMIAHTVQDDEILCTTSNWSPLKVMITHLGILFLNMRS
jgi:hypothetical protein